MTRFIEVEIRSDSTYAPVQHTRWLINPDHVSAVVAPARC